MTDVASPAPNPGDGRLEGLRICVIYDCLFPLTHGGAERWYRLLVDNLVAAGASVTYLTRRQWTTERPQWLGVQVVAVTGASELYDADGTRRTAPAIEFGLGTFKWMIRHRHEYDAVVVASFPFFSLLAVRAALARTGTPVLVDYFEVWSSEYWRSYAGRLTGTLGSMIQRLCIAVSRYAQVFTEQSAQQLRAHGFHGDVAVLPGLLSSISKGSVSYSSHEDQTMLFVGRHVKHKGVRLLPEILAAARVSLPNLTLTIVSDGPERAAVERDVSRLGLTNAVLFTGPISDDALREQFERASCTVVPSLREGYGLVVAESVITGTPVVVANNAENLATSLVEEGVNGFVVEPSIRGMAAGVVEAISAGDSLRRSTVEWSIQQSQLRSMDRSANVMVERLRTLARRLPQ